MLFTEPTFLFLFLPVLLALYFITGSREHSSYGNWLLLVASVLFYAKHGAEESTHLLVLDINKFDRSPCGTGTSARLAQLKRHGRIPADGIYRAKNILGVPFLARIAGETKVNGFDAVIAEIEGSAHLTVI